MNLKNNFSYIKGWLLLVFVSLLGCSNMLYYPTPIKYIHEKSLKYPPQEINLQNKDKEDLVAWYFEAPKNIRKNTTLIFFHGNGQNLSAHFLSLYWILEYGYNFLIFDYEGYGPNAGQPNPQNTVETGQLAIKWVSENRPKDKMAIFGQSLGGNVALRTLSENTSFIPCHVTIESSFLSYKKIAQSVLNRNWFTWPFQFLAYILLSDKYAISSRLQSLPQTHYLVLHGKQDEVVPFKFGAELFEALPDNKKFIEIPDGKHSNAFTRRLEYRPILLDQLHQFCS